MQFGRLRKVAGPFGIAVMLGLLSAAPVTEPSSDSKIQAVLQIWGPRFREEGLRYVVAGPFVIAGNGTAGQLAAYRDGTILAATKALEATYFQTPLREPVVICLFESEGPYRRLARKWFDQADVPHFGFYRHGDRVMFMNVGTGTGTLVHELTHALIAPDFPKVPAWFNDGLRVCMSSVRSQATRSPACPTGGCRRCKKPFGTEHFGR